MKKLLALSAVSLLAACTTAEAPLAAGETSIPYFGTTGILEWRAAGEDALYIRGDTGRWYLVRTSGLCSRLRSATTLGYETRGVRQIDRFTTLLVEGQRCPVASVVRSPPPPEPARS